jgi:hypothetical protein
MSKPVMKKTSSNRDLNGEPGLRGRSETVSATTSPRAEKKISIPVTDKSKRTIRRNVSESAIPDGPDKVDLEYDPLHLASRAGNIEGLY